jgi:hypothetical protein
MGHPQKDNTNPKVKGSGQECPLYTSVTMASWLT